MTPTDIVKLLRWWEPDTVVRPKTLMRKAAAEIERLREERRKVRLPLADLSGRVSRDSVVDALKEAGVEVEG